MPCTNLSNWRRNCITVSCKDVPQEKRFLLFASKVINHTCNPKSTAAWGIWTLDPWFTRPVLCHWANEATTSKQLSNAVLHSFSANATARKYSSSWLISGFDLGETSTFDDVEYYFIWLTLQHLLKNLSHLWKPQNLMMSRRRPFWARALVIWLV